MGASRSKEWDDIVVTQNGRMGRHISSLERSDEFVTIVFGYYR
jgi:hypothetical protein